MMIRKGLIIVGIAAIAGVVFAQSKNLGAISTYVEKASSAKSLRAEFTVTQIGSTSDSYTLQFSKPNLFKIDGPGKTIVGDGSQVTTYDKAAKTYFKSPQTAESLNAVLSSDEVSLFAPFFNIKAYDNIKVVGSSTKKRAGVEMQVVETKVDATGKKGATFFVDPSGVAKQLEFNYTDNNSRILVSAKTMEFGGTTEEASLYAFKAPSGSRELSMEEMNSDKWYTDLDEALKAAKSSNRLVLLDVYAVWCGPCKMLERDVYPQEEFKKMSKYFVFCKVDGEAVPSVMKAYNVTAFPTIKFLNSSGSEIHGFLGYVPTSKFVAEMETARSKAGK